MGRAYFLLKDPHWAFLWWSISEDIRKRLFGSLSLSRPGLSLRFHDITDILFDGGNSHSFLEVAASETSDHWYIRLPVAGRVYCAEVGFHDQLGRYLPAVRSNALWLPPEAPQIARPEPLWSRLDLG